MVMYAGLVLLCFLGIAAAGEDTLGPNQFQTHHQWNHGPLTTVCIQVRGPHGPELCGPMVSPPEVKDNPELPASRNADPAGGSGFDGMIQQDHYRSAQPGSWVGPQPNPPMPIRSAVLQGFIGNGPIYQMEPGRAVDTLPPMVRVNSFQPPPPMALVRVPEQSQHQSVPCVEHGVRFAGVPPQVMMAPSPEMAPSQFVNPAAQPRTFPFAPFGIEQPSGPPRQHVGQLVGARASNTQFMPSMRSADCLDNFQQPVGGGAAMRASSSSYRSTQQQQDAQLLAKQCEQQEQEIMKKKEEIRELKKQLDKMSESAKASSSTTIEQKNVTTKSSQGQSDKEMKSVDKEFNDSSRQNIDMPERRKKEIVKH